MKDYEEKYTALFNQYIPIPVIMQARHRQLRLLWER